MQDVIEGARRDAGTLEQAGFDAVLVENFGDAPFFPGAVPPSTVAAISTVVTAVRQVWTRSIGINVLRNDAEAAVAIAAAVGAEFVRVNVLSGSMFTDQGLLAGRAAQVLRLRAALAPHTEIYADVFVKHATPPPGTTFEQAAEDTWERAGADALIVSGTATGAPTDLGRVNVLRKILPDAPIIVGSGVTVETVADALAVADGVIVGTGIKDQGVTTAPVNPERASRLVEAASTIA
jgi:membrane complex biogenesis BtpA family protein